jgi:hypothetical protein
MGGRPGGQAPHLEFENLEAFPAAPANVEMPLGRRGPDFPILVEDEVVVAKVLQPVGAGWMSSFIHRSIRRRGPGRRSETPEQGDA